MDKRALHKLSYGVYIVTSVYEGEKAGYVANTVFQVSSDPPVLAISCHKNNATLRSILGSGIFAVTVLEKETAAALIGEFGYFSGTESDKFSKVRHLDKTTGAPVIMDSCTAWLDCRVVATLDVGTHLLITGEVVDAAVVSEAEPLTYAWYREKFRASSPKNAPTYNDSPEKISPVEKVTPAPDLKAVEEEADSEPYICTICGYIYRPVEGDPSERIPPGTAFSDVPESYRCPVCNAGKDYFRPMG